MCYACAMQSCPLQFLKMVNRVRKLLDVEKFMIQRSQLQNEKNTTGITTKMHCHLICNKFQNNHPFNIPLIPCRHNHTQSIKHEWIRRVRSVILYEATVHLPPLPQRPPSQGLRDVAVSLGAQPARHHPSIWMRRFQAATERVEPCLVCVGNHK